jgi:hypothetical protein
MQEHETEIYCKCSKKEMTRLVITSITHTNWGNTMVIEVEPHYCIPRTERIEEWLYDI